MNDGIGIDLFQLVILFHFNYYITYLVKYLNENTFEMLSQNFKLFQDV